MAAEADRIDTLAHRDPEVARCIHGVLQRAYAQEAELLQVRDFPPLQRTAAHIQADAALYLGSWRGERLLGALAIERDDDPGQLLVATLTVDPGFQRQGVARALLRHALRLGEGMTFAVNTAAGNAPALALYTSEGFVPYRQGTLGPDSLPIVKLRRVPPAPAAAPHQASRHATGAAGPPADGLRRGRRRRS